MRITRIEPIPIAIPLTRNFGGSTYRVTSRATIVTRLHTDDGLVSEVYNGDNRDHGGAIARIIRDELAPLLIGEDAFAVERLWERMFQITRPARDRKLAMEAIACVDTALWDVIGKALGRNVATLLGGYRKRLPIIAIGGYYFEGRTLADFGREMEGHRRAGMAGCKFKVGGLSPAEDAARVEAARAGGGPDFVLAVDANRGWSAADAIDFARRVERFNIAWFEEPCHWQDDGALMAKVRRATSIPITAGQSEITGQAIRRLIEAEAVDLVNFDASAMPHGTYAECFANAERDPVWEQMVLNRPPAKDGIIAVPEGPGFGLALDWKMVEKHRLDG
jgi:D-galactarolactone cycloisomerase